MLSINNALPQNIQLLFRDNKKHGCSSYTDAYFIHDIHSYTQDRNEMFEFPLYLHGYTSNVIEFKTTTDNTDFLRDISTIVNQTVEKQITLLFVNIPGRYSKEEFNALMQDNDSFIKHNKDAITTIVNTYTDKTSSRNFDKTSAYYEQHAIIYNHKTKPIIIFCTDAPDIWDNTALQLTTGLIPVLYPEIKAELNAIELEYFKELIQRTQVKRLVNKNILELTTKVLEQDYIKEELKKLAHNNMIDSVINCKLRTSKKRMDDTQKELDRLEAQYQDTYEDFIKLRRNYVGLSEELKNQTKEELDLIFKIKNIIDITSLGNNRYVFKIKGTFKYYDTEELECILKNYSPDMQLLLKEIFIEQNYHLNVLDYVILDFNYNRYSGFGRELTSTDYAVEHAVFNPHHYYFSCLGDYSATLTKTLGDNNYAMFINTVLSSVQSINFSDGIVCQRFLNDIAGTFEDYNSFLSHECIIDDEGNLYTFASCLKHIKETKEANENEQDAN